MMNLLREARGKTARAKQLRQEADKLGCEVCEIEREVYAIEREGKGADKLITYFLSNSCTAGAGFVERFRSRRYQLYLTCATPDSFKLTNVISGESYFFDNHLMFLLEAPVILARLESEV